jgi:hypothetical protein
MDIVVRQFLEQLVLGDEMRCDRLSVLPIFSGFQAPLDYIALQTAIETHDVRVEEVSESGSVGDLRVTNTGEISVLALDGEELTGAKQNRILNTTILLERNTLTVVPVSCTEQGRWSHISMEFASSCAFAPPRIRENTKRSVNQALAENRGFKTNQGQVWDHVSRIAAAAGVHSPTNALSDVVKSRLPQLNSIVADMPVAPRQCGLLAILDTNVLGFDVVSRPEVYARLHDRLLRSYLMETDSSPRVAPAPDARKAASVFIQSAVDAQECHFPSPGMGEDYRYSNKGIVGSALVAEGQVAHLAFFRVSPEEGTEWNPGLTSYRTRMGFRSGCPNSADSGASGA